MEETAPTGIDELLENEGWLRAIAARLVDEADRAEDVVQETWLAALRHPPRHRGGLRGWLAAVARNAARQMRRREERLARREQRAAVHEGLPSAAEAAERAELRRAIVEEVLGLDEPYRTAIRLRYLEGMRLRDVAGRCGVLDSTAAMRVSRGLAQLRGRLGATRRVARRRGLPALLALLLRPRRLVTVQGGAVLAVASLALLAVAVLSFAVPMAGPVPPLRAVAARAAPAVEVVPETTGPAVPEPGGDSHAMAAAEAEAGTVPEAAGGQGGPADPIEGIVVDQHGAPVVGAELHFGYRGGGKSGSAAAPTTTGPDGRFSLHVVEGSRWSVCVFPPQPWGRWMVPAQETNNVDAGDRGLVFHAVRLGVPEGEVRARVVDADSGEPVVPERSLLIPEAAASWVPGPRSAYREAGSVRLGGVHPGAYRLWVTTRDRPAAWAPVLVPVGRCAVDVRVEVGRYGAISGRLETADGALLREEQVSVRILGTGPFARWIGDPGWGRASTVTDGSGEFRVEGLTPGRYEVCHESGGRPARSEVEVPSGSEARVFLRAEPEKGAR